VLQLNLLAVLFRAPRKATAEALARTVEALARAAQALARTAEALARDAAHFFFFLFLFIFFCFKKQFVKHSLFFYNGQKNS